MPACRSSDAVLPSGCSSPRLLKVELETRGFGRIKAFYNLDRLEDILVSAYDFSVFEIDSGGKLSLAPEDCFRNIQLVSTQVLRHMVSNIVLVRKTKIAGVA